MLRKPLLVLFALLLATSALARTRATSHPQPRIDAATVHGLVTSVSGNIIAIAGGLVTIDASEARILVGRGEESTVAAIEPGMIVFATVRANETPNAPLVATTIAATRLADATLFGSVDAVDRTNRTITVLGRTIDITNETSFGGMLRDGNGSLDDLLPDQLVQVQTEAVNGRLVASSVLVVSQIPPNVHAARGTVRSIGAGSWTIEREGGEVLTLVIDAQTKIAGSPKVGDRVEVLYRTDSANANIAIAIARFEMPSMPNITRVNGVVRTIGATAWTIGTTTVKIDERTKIAPRISVGDTVEVLAEKKDDGTLVALVIMKIGF